MPGPAPKPDEQRARRNPSRATVRLPAEGRAGRAPAWPLVDDVVLAARLKVAKQVARDKQIIADDPDLGPRARAKADQELAKVRTEVTILEEQIKAQRKLERTLWSELWKTPQAVQWEKLRWTRTVAQYVRWKALAELGDIKASQEARQQEDRLGLSPKAMQQLGWEVGPALASAGGGTPGPRSRSATPRSRYGNLRVVGKAAGE